MANPEVLATPDVLKTQSNDSSFSEIWLELQWRGLIAISTDEAELRKALNQTSMTYYSVLTQPHRVCTWVT